MARKGELVQPRSHCVVRGNYRTLLSCSVQRRYYFGEFSVDVASTTQPLSFVFLTMLLCAVYCCFSTFVSQGRVRTKTVKRVAREIIEKYYTRLTLDFHTNKRICADIADIPSKRLRNKIAG